MKTGLVLEGGGMRGIYTAGILDVFMEKDIYFDGVIGVSAGAIHGCSFVSRQKGRSIRYYKKYCKDPRFMSFRSLLTTGNFIGAQFCYHDLPEKLDVYDFETFDQSKTKFFVTCTDLDTGKPAYRRITDMRGQIDYLRASASLPYFSNIVTIDGKNYLDGGCSDSVPVDAFRSFGYNRNVIILTRPAEYVKKPEHTGLASLVYRKYPAFVETLKKRHINYNETMKRIHQLETEGSVFVIRPEASLNIGRLENNPDKIQQIYDQGRQDGLKALDAMKAFLTGN